MVLATVVSCSPVRGEEWTGFFVTSCFQEVSEPCTGGSFLVVFVWFFGLCFVVVGLLGFFFDGT